MAVYNLGSINADNVYRVTHQPVAGETLAAESLTRGLGGKGANMSVAAARAAARVVHIGAVGTDGQWARERLLEYGVDTRFIAVSDLPTGHANICVDPEGENTIVLLSGANGGITDDMIGAALSDAGTGDIFVTQNETNGQREAVAMAARLGLRVVYAAAPFDAKAVRAVIDRVDLLVLNAVEASQLAQETGSEPGDLPCSDVVVTMGGDGCIWYSKGQEAQRFPAIPVTPVDTTGAGDTFTGYLIAGLDRGMPMAQAIGLATKAGALMVMREGTADVIPDLKEIEDYTFG
ncbi:ribokinase [uncultured Roseobacter sp.]|uniref:ribokinase n=1 Tax=uncultured Roseobacter sp. TaxID=114847 RepID=UPI00262EECEE|nr:ribokinase [uncultured Roseobacter sp.]